MLKYHHSNIVHRLAAAASVIVISLSLLVIFMLVISYQGDA